MLLELIKCQIKHRKRWDNLFLVLYVKIRFNTSAPPDPHAMQTVLAQVYARPYLIVGSGSSILKSRKRGQGNDRAKMLFQP